MIRTRRRLILSTILLLIVLSPIPTTAYGAELTTRPNIVLILIDDMGRNDLGCYGSTYYHTPRIDRLAGEGMRFTDYYAACPVCSPTRASILTGKYPARLNLTDWLPGRPDRPDQALQRPKIRQELPPEEITLAEVLHDAGYATAHIGKWHLGNEGFEPTHQGFDLNIAGDVNGSPRKYFAPFRSDGHFMPGLEKAEPNEYLTDRLTTEAIKFIEQNRNRPFFLYLPHYAVHTPLRAKEGLIQKYVQGTPGVQGNPTYAAMIESVDESVGRIRDTLDQLQLTEKTVVIFTSDNGGLSVVEGERTPSTTNRPLREGKGYLYEGGIRTPLIVKWPGATQAGSTSNVPAGSIDLFPTILEICGLTSDAKPDGVSLASVLRGGAAPQRAALFWHYPHYSNQGGKPGGAIRASEYKLIEFFEDGRRELYDVANDSGEHRNLSAAHPDIVEKLATQLAAWRTSVGAHMMQKNPDYVPNPPNREGRIVLAAQTAHVQGVQLRFEAEPHKNTLGYWTEVDDSAEWQFTVERPGKFTVTLLQGCGQGHGGSHIEVRVADQTLEMTVQDTGHFQNFVPREIGVVNFDKPGRYSLTVKPKDKAAAAVMDLRSITLAPQ